MEENRLISLLSKHWSKILLGLLALACIGVWSERLFRSGNAKNKEDYQVSNQIIEQFQRGSWTSDTIASAQNILKRHPEMHPKLDPLLTLTLLSQSKPVEALPYATSLIKNAEGFIPPYYKEYAGTTLLISREEYKAAFQEALSLQEKLKGKSGYEKLEGMNLLRLVFLSDRLGEKEQKLLFWKKLQSHSAYSHIEPLFHEGSLTLADYMKK